jgi:hypothetical protein
MVQVPFLTDWHLCPVPTVTALPRPTPQSLSIGMSFLLCSRSIVSALPALNPIATRSNAWPRPAAVIGKEVVSGGLHFVSLSNHCRNTWSVTAVVHEHKKEVPCCTPYCTMPMGQAA